jgi:hypothetical protein
MRFRKVILFVTLLLVCFKLAARPAKADQFNPTGTSCTTTSAQEICSVNLQAPVGATFASSNLPASYLIGGEGNHTVSDELDPLVFVVGNAFVTFKFVSDGPGVPGVVEVGGVPCPPIIGCNITENGTVQQVVLAGGTPVTINWSNGAQDTIAFASDVSEVPEPASLILLGSGLVVTGGFLRRRQRLVTPSA